MGSIAAKERVKIYLNSGKSHYDTAVTFINQLISGWKKEEWVLIIADLSQFSPPRKKSATVRTSSGIPVKFVFPQKKGEKIPLVGKKVRIDC